MPAQDARKLLNYIVHHHVATMEEKKAEFTARALDPDDQPAITAGHEVQTEAEAAERLFPAFYAALLYAGAHRGAAAFVFDDTDPQQNAMADSLIRFLVKPNLAAVESEEVGPAHYRYRVTIDWPAMERMATLARVDLGAVLAL